MWTYWSDWDASQPFLNNIDPATFLHKMTLTPSRRVWRRREHLSRQKDSIPWMLMGILIYQSTDMGQIEMSRSPFWIMSTLLPSYTWWISHQPGEYEGAGRTYLDRRTRFHGCWWEYWFTNPQIWVRLRCLAALFWIISTPLPSYTWWLSHQPGEYEGKGNTYLDRRTRSHGCWWEY